MERIVSREVIFSGAKFSVLRLKVQLETGKVITREIVDKGGNSVAMVAVDAEQQLYLVEEYFAAVDQRLLCLPKGMVDEGEEPAEAAVRELEEEIGLTGTARFLTDMTLSPGYLTQRTSLFLLTDLKPTERAKPEEHHLARMAFPLSEAVAMVRRGQISEARTVAGILWADALLL